MMRKTLVFVLFSAVVLLAPLPAWATYPGPVGRIAFTSPSQSHAEIWSMKGGGGGKRLLTEPPRENMNPSWNVDGTRIVFVTVPPSGTQQIFAMNASGNLRTQITTGTRNWADPAISPDGKWIVAVGWDRPADNKNLWLIKADGSGSMHRFTKYNATDSGPSFSPDDTKIVWTRTRPNGKSDIEIKNVDKTGLDQLTGGAGDNTGASFSPDGTKIAFTHIIGVKGTGSLWTMDVNGSHKNKLTKTPAGAVWNHACWSPNGKKVAFIWQRGPTRAVPDIFTVNYPGGGGRTNLTGGGYTPEDLDWGVGS